MENGINKATYTIIRTAATWKWFDGLEYKCTEIKEITDHTGKKTYKRIWRNTTLQSVKHYEAIAFSRPLNTQNLNKSL